MPFYEKGDVRIHYQETGSGFPLLVIPGGGLNSTVAGLANHPFNPMEELKDEHRVIAADLRNANGGQSSGPLETDRPWDAYTDDHFGLMDHLGIREFLVLGFCIGGPFIWNLLGGRPTASSPRCWRSRAAFARRRPTSSIRTTSKAGGRRYVSAGRTSRWRRWTRFSARCTAPTPTLCSR